MFTGNLWKDVGVHDPQPAADGSKPGGPATTLGPSSATRRSHLVRTVLGIATGLFAVATIVAFSTAATTPAPAPIRNAATVRFTYGAKGPAGGYENGVVQTGDPISVSIPKVDLIFGYGLSGPGADVRGAGGTLRIDEKVSFQGREVHSRLLGEKLFSGTSGSYALSLDVHQLLADRSGYGTLFSVKKPNGVVSIVPTLHYTGVHVPDAAANLTTNKFTFLLTDSALVPSLHGQTEMTDSSTGLTWTGQAHGRDLSFAGMAVSVATARLLAIALLLVSIIAYGVSDWRARRRSLPVRSTARLKPADGSDIASLGSASVLSNALDVGRIRESTRRRRLWKVFLCLAPIGAFMAYRIAQGEMIRLGAPHLSQQQMEIALPLGLIFVLCIVLVVPMMAMGKSPHMRYDPSEISTTMNDVVGLGPVKDEVVKSLNLFLGYQTFRDVMGGNPRKGVLFEGPPGTGKTYMAKAMAREAGVPFLFVSATAFQSQYYGATGRKIRNYFKELRKAAAEEGGAIGFIEEIDAIAGARSGMRMTPAPDQFRSVPFAADGLGRQVNRDSSEGISGVVNELLIQLQSFDAPTSAHRFASWWIDGINRLLPAHRRINKKPPTPSNILVIAATNRAADLDPALLRPGRFDRSIHFDLPNRIGRREIIDYYLDRKAHVPELDKEERRDALAAMTFGYTPVMIEHLFDEGLVWALRDGRAAMEWADVQQAKMTEEIGLKQPVEYTEDEKRTIATHEAGHATVAYLVGQNRKLEVLSIIKRRDALGLLAHTDMEERYTRTRSELLGMMKIAFGGMTAEELFFGESGTGPGGDLVHATKIASQMVGSFGMAGSLVSYEAIEAGPITQGIVGKVLGNEDARAAVERLLEQAKADVQKILDDNRHLVIALRDELLAKEEIIGDEIVEVLREAEARHRLAQTGAGK